MRPAIAAFVAALCVAAPCAAAPGAAAPAFVSYVDPDKQFSVKYPAGWRVKRDGHISSFYLDDADEGTRFTVLPPPSVALRGELSIAQVFVTVIVEPNTARYKTFRVLKYGDHSLASNPDNAVREAVAAWTNSRGVKMSGWMKLYALKNVGHGFTTISFLGYQAPDKEFDGLERTVFREMVASLKYGPGR